MDVNALISGLLGQSDPAMAAATPRLTKGSRNLPKQQRGKVKEARQDLPAETETPAAEVGDPNIEALITAALGDPSMQGMGIQDMIAELTRTESGKPYQPDADYLMELLTSQAGLPITPEMKAPKTTGTAYPANFSPETAIAQLLAKLGVGPDPETPNDDTPYVNDEDEDDD